jgi:DNA (cytosine-5)-methyltransferase 1
MCWWDGSQKADTLTTRSLNQRMPDKQQFPCIVDTRFQEVFEGSVSPSLLATDYKEPKAVISDVCPTLDASYPGKMNNQDTSKLICYPDEAVSIAENIIGRKVENGGNGVGAKEGVCYTLDTVGVHGVCYPIDMTNIDGRDLKARCFDDDGESAYSLTRRRPSGVCTPGVIRRLLPVECERLMGFPDFWTMIPWRGKPADLCPDGPRYKALGNSMCTNVMMWIGERIEAAEKEKRNG